MLIKIAVGAAVVAAMGAACYFSGVMSEAPNSAKKIAASEASIKEARAKTAAAKVTAEKQLQLTKEKREQDQRNHETAMANIHA